MFSFLFSVVFIFLTYSLFNARQLKEEKRALKEKLEQKASEVDRASGELSHLRGTIDGLRAELAEKDNKFKEKSRTLKRDNSAILSNVSKLEMETMSIKSSNLILEQQIKNLQVCFQFCVKVG